MDTLSEKILKLIEELRGKGLIPAEYDVESMEDPGDKGVRHYMFGYIEGLAENSAVISRQQADSYIAELGLTPAEIDRLRADFRKTNEHKRKLN